MILQLCESDEEDSFDERPLTSQLWYHGEMERQDAHDLLMMHRHLGEGTFLIRSGNKGLALSFL